MHNYRCIRDIPQLFSYTKTPIDEMDHLHSVLSLAFLILGLGAASPGLPARLRQRKAAFRVMGSYLEQEPEKLQEACKLSDAELATVRAGFLAWNGCMESVASDDAAGEAECDEEAESAGGTEPAGLGEKMDCIMPILVSSVFVESGLPESEARLLTDAIVDLGKQGTTN